MYKRIDYNTRLAPTVGLVTPIAVGCEIGACREHTGVPRNRRSFSSPTGPIEEKVLNRIQQHFVLLLIDVPPTRFSPPFYSPREGRYKLTVALNARYFFCT
jgi:hypothetical protein